ncbi:MAG: leucine-rich repeat domain-containing protein, partial [Clostridiales bacterium]|nr:leucine-rich repeat domain-containing protein [Clostridiales bacterium]
MQNTLKRYAALLLAVCLLLAGLPRPAIATEAECDVMTADETEESDASESGEDGDIDDDSDSGEYEYDAPTITAIETVTEYDDFYVCVTWDVVEEYDYMVLRSTDGGDYELAGYATYPGEDETEVTYQDAEASLYHTYTYAVCVYDSDSGEAVSDYGYSEEHYFPSGDCGDNVAWKISSDGLLTVSGSGDMVEAWEAGFAAWYPMRTVVKTVEIGEGVASVAPYSFQECTNLTAVSIPDSVTVVGDCAFYGCSSLETVTIPEGVTEIPYRTFYLCTGLTSVSLPSTVTTIGVGAFGSCTGLTDLTLPGGLTELGNSAFYKCTGLTSLVIPDGVTALPMNALYGCTGLTSLTLPDGLTELGIRALFNCTGLTSLELPESLTTIGSGALQLCSGLTELTVPASVTSIGSYAFYACTGLETISFLGAPPETLSNWFGEVACTAIVTEESADEWFALDLSVAGSEVTWTTSAQSNADGEENTDTAQVTSLDTPSVTLSNASTGVKVTWGAVDGAQSYRVYRKVSG